MGRLTTGCDTTTLPVAKFTASLSPSPTPKVSYRS